MMLHRMNEGSPIKKCSMSAGGTSHTRVSPSDRASPWVCPGTPPRGSPESRGDGGRAGDGEEGDDAWSTLDRNDNRLLVCAAFKHAGKSETPSSSSKQPRGNIFILNLLIRTRLLNTETKSNVC